MKLYILFLFIVLVSCNDGGSDPEFVRLKSEKVKIDTIIKPTYYRSGYYSNGAEIVDSGDWKLRPDTIKPTRIDKDYLLNQRFRISKYEGGKVDYWHVIIVDSAGEVAYLKLPTDQWVIEDTARALRALLKYLKDEADMLHKYDIKLSPKKDTLAYPYTVK